jgi:hypothetical protein
MHYGKSQGNFRAQNLSHFVLHAPLRKRDHYGSLENEFMGQNCVYNHCSLTSHTLSERGSGTLQWSGLFWTLLSQKYKSQLIE